MQAVLPGLAPDVATQLDRPGEGGRGTSAVDLLHLRRQRVSVPRSGVGGGRGKAFRGPVVPVIGWELCEPRRRCYAVVTLLWELPLLRCCDPPICLIRDLAIRVRPRAAKYTCLHA